MNVVGWARTTVPLIMLGVFDAMTVVTGDARKSNSIARAMGNEILLAIPNTCYSPPGKAEYRKINDDFSEQRPKFASRF